MKNKMINTKNKILKKRAVAEIEKPLQKQGGEKK
jgi:hypothetical protein